jgi:hypothetical protein
MSEDTLFDLDAYKDAPRPKGETCGKCKHAIRPHPYRPDWIYCKATASNRTQFGILKVKSRQAACRLFERTK